MLAVTIGLLLTVVIAVGILALVALPYLRAGSPILTPESGRVVERAKEQAKHKPVAAAGSTWHGMVALQRWIAKVWAPISVVLHEGMDRLEGRDGVATMADSLSAPGENASAAADLLGGSLVAGSAGGSAAVGRPRSIPTDSGPIPTAQPSIAQPSTAQPLAARGAGHSSALRPAGSRASVGRSSASRSTSAHSSATRSAASSPASHSSGGAGVIDLRDTAALDRQAGIVRRSR